MRRPSVTTEHDVVARHALRRTIAATAAAGAVAVTVAAALVLAPVQDAPEQADAIVVLGGLGSRAVLDEATRLAEAGYADRVVVSDAFGGDRRPSRLCRTRPELYECVEPRPATTAGEARLVQRLASERGWTSLLVVTRTYHVTRARLILGQCVDAELRVLGAESDLTFGDGAYQILYQSSAAVRALIDPAC